jgi:hypothetical protein
VPGQYEYLIIKSKPFLKQGVGLKMFDRRLRDGIREMSGVINVSGLCNVAMNVAR